jgi:hypothetical protein
LKAIKEKYDCPIKNESGKLHLTSLHDSPNLLGLSTGHIPQTPFEDTMLSPSQILQVDDPEPIVPVKG